MRKSGGKMFGTIETVLRKCFESAGKNVNNVCEKCSNCECRESRTLGTREQVQMIYLQMQIFFQRSVIILY